LARSIEAACRKQDARVKAIRAASVSENVYEVHLVDSSGGHIQSQATRYSASVTCKAEENGEAQMGGDFGFSTDLDRLGTEVIDAVGKQSALHAVELLGAGSCPSFQGHAILRNSVVAELVEFLAASFSAEEIAKGRSMLAGKLGQRLFSEHVTLIDDGLLAGGYATSPFDGEGVPSSQTTLVDGGIAAAALYDVYYGRKEGKEPTGSSQRGIKAPPSIGFSNLYLKAGRKTPAKLLELFTGISRGILITDLMGVHTANPVTGDFSLGASGLLVENGRVTRPVRGFAVAGNVLEVFRRMTDIGNDLRFFGNVGAPSVRVSELAVSGT
jgi:PmbA protein